MLRLDNGYAISAVPSNMVGEAWPAVHHLLKSALDEGWGFEPADVFQRIAQGQVQLWVVEHDMNIKAAIVTEILDYPQLKTLNIWLLAGENFKEFREAIASLESYARHHGCKAMECTGRPGLQKLIQGLGFNRPRITFVKPIDLTTH